MVEYELFYNALEQEPGNVLTPPIPPRRKKKRGFWFRLGEMER
jgi:hypothetical protein